MTLGIADIIAILLITIGPLKAKHRSLVADRDRWPWRRLELGERFAIPGAH